MTDSDQGRVPSSAEADARVRIDRAVGRARLNLIWEAVWPGLAPVIALAGLFAALSWFGLWRVTSTPARYAILAAFALALVYYLIRLARFAWPTRAAAFARVEQATGAPHRPATSFSDKMATGNGDPLAEALWMAHRQRLLAAMDRPPRRCSRPAPQASRSARLPLPDPAACRRRLLRCRRRTHRPHRRSLPGRRIGRRDRRAHRCVGDAADLTPAGRRSS